MNKNQINNMIRTGEVTEVDAQRCTVRVVFSDEDNIVSQALPVIMTGCVANKDKKLPAKGDAVVCIFLSIDLSVGWCLGAYYNDEDLPPDNNLDTEVKQFSDGTMVSYNTKKHALTVKCTDGGVVNVEAKTAIIKAEKTVIDGDLNVTGTTNTKSLKVKDKDWLIHKHAAGELIAPDGPVTGISAIAIQG